MRAYLIALILFTICLNPAVSAHNQTPDTIITVDSTNLRFSPETVTINEGDAIRFFWSGQILPHNAVEENGTFDSGDTESSEDYRFVFVAGINGTFGYYCEPHRTLGMVGQVIVNPISNTSNNTTTEGNQTDIPMEDDDESFMPFVSLQSLMSVVLVAVLLRKENKLQQ